VVEVISVSRARAASRSRPEFEIWHCAIPSFMSPPNADRGAHDAYSRTVAPPSCIGTVLPISWFSIILSYHTRMLTAGSAYACWPNEQSSVSFLGCDILGI
jgi:hypothetical protein